MTAWARLAAILATLGLAACVTEDTTVTTKSRVEVVATVNNFAPPQESPVRVGGRDER